MAREFKDSGIEWIGQIPKEWEVCRLKNVGYLYGGLTGKAGDDFNVGDEDTSYMLYIPFTNIFNNDTINPDQLFKVKIESGEVQNLVQKGDLLFLMSSEDFDGVGKPAIMEEQVENLGLNSFCKGMRVTNSETNSKYLFYLLSSHLLRELVRQEAKGFIRINLRQDRLSCCPVFLPSLTEQQKIADYLDKVCSEVDEMVAIQETMIEELKAYKQSVITEAVTKGLNPNAPMRNSGIDWIGEIPEHWELGRLKHVCKINGRIGFRGYTSEDLVSEGEGAYTIGGKHISRNVIDLSNPDYLSWDKYYESPEIMVKKGDMVIAQRGTLGRVALIREEIGPATINPSLVLLNNISNNAIYLYWWLCSSSISVKIDLLNTSTAVPMISQKQIENLELLLPPLAEQRAIAAYLDTKCSEIDSLIALKQAKIEELKEYKKSVIYEYVTGKKEVV